MAWAGNFNYNYFASLSHLADARLLLMYEKTNKKREDRFMLQKNIRVQLGISSLKHRNSFKTLLVTEKHKTSEAESDDVETLIRKLFNIHPKA